VVRVAPRNPLSFSGGLVVKSGDSSLDRAPACSWPSYAASVARLLRRLHNHLPNGASLLLPTCFVHPREPERVQGWRAPAAQLESRQMEILQPPLFPAPVSSAGNCTSGRGNLLTAKWLCRARDYNRSFCLDGLLWAYTYALTGAPAKF
jgi:hypothetical protein